MSGPLNCQDIGVRFCFSRAYASSSSKSDSAIRIRSRAVRSIYSLLVPVSVVGCHLIHPLPQVVHICSTRRDSQHYHSNRCAPCRLTQSHGWLIFFLAPPHPNSFPSLLPRSPSTAAHQSKMPTNPESESLACTGYEFGFRRTKFMSSWYAFSRPDSPTS